MILFWIGICREEVILELDVPCLYAPSVLFRLRSRTVSRPLPSSTSLIAVTIDEKRFYEWTIEFIATDTAPHKTSLENRFAKLTLSHIQATTIVEHGNQLLVPVHL